MSEPTWMASAKRWRSCDPQHLTGSGDSARQMACAALEQYERAERLELERNRVLKQRDAFKKKLERLEHVRIRKTHDE